MRLEGGALAQLQYRTVPTRRILAPHSRGERVSDSSPGSPNIPAFYVVSYAGRQRCVLLGLPVSLSHKSMTMARSVSSL